MGLFILPPKVHQQCTPEELVQTAIYNLEL
jgi:hypothetical protein